MSSQKSPVRHVLVEPGFLVPVSACCVGALDPTRHRVPCSVPQGPAGFDSETALAAHQSPPSTHLGDEVLGAGLEQVLQLLGVHVHGPQLVPQHRGVVGSDQGGGVVPHLWSSRGREVRTRSARGTAARRGVSPQGRGEYPAPRSRRQTGTQHCAARSLAACGANGGRNSATYNYCTRAG